ncbi:lipid II flippase MurJ, partial [Leuconostoc mesenteroides]
SHVVYGYAAGFLFQALRSNLVRIFYAFQNTRIPMMNGAIAVALNIFLCITLSRFIGVGGISLATSISMFIVSMLLFPRIKRFIPGFSMRST